MVDTRNKFDSRRARRTTEPRLPFAPTRVTFLIIWVGEDILLVARGWMVGLGVLRKSGEGENKATTAETGTEICIWIEIGLGK